MLVIHSQSRKTTKGTKHIFFLYLDFVHTLIKLTQKDSTKHFYVKARIGKNQNKKNDRNYSTKSTYSLS